MNFAYKLDDREATEKLAENLSESILDGNREAVLKPVSYTHLDVYKRQALPITIFFIHKNAECGRHFTDRCTEKFRYVYEMQIHG